MLSKFRLKATPGTRDSWSISTILITAFRSESLAQVTSKMSSELLEHLRSAGIFIPGGKPTDKTSP